MFPSPQQQHLAPGTLTIQTSTSDARNLKFNLGEPLVLLKALKIGADDTRLNRGDLVFPACSAPQIIARGLIVKRNLYSAAHPDTSFANGIEGSDFISLCDLLRTSVEHEGIAATACGTIVTFYQNSREIDRLTAINNLLANYSLRQLPKSFISQQTYSRITNHSSKFSYSGIVFDDLSAVLEFLTTFNDNTTTSTSNAIHALVTGIQSNFATSNQDYYEHNMDDFTLYHELIRASIRVKRVADKFMLSITDTYSGDRHSKIAISKEKEGRLAIHRIVDTFELAPIAEEIYGINLNAIDAFGVSSANLARRAANELYWDGNEIIKGQAAEYLLSVDISQPTVSTNLDGTMRRFTAFETGLFLKSPLNADGPVKVTLTLRTVGDDICTDQPAVRSEMISLCTQLSSALLRGSSDVATS